MKSMKGLNVMSMRKTREEGFTIIELIVVILLLGILTATALPRFLDVSDEAHQAVVDAVEGGTITGLALFRAAYVAGGENDDAAIPQFGNGSLWSDENGSGYPADAIDGALGADAIDCLAIYNQLLQEGRPVAAGVAAPDTDPGTESAIEAAALAGADFVVTPNLAAAPTGCYFYYVGQYQSGDAAVPRTIQRLDYLMATGSIIQTTHLLDQI